MNGHTRALLCPAGWEVLKYGEPAQDGDKFLDVSEWNFCGKIVFREVEPDDIGLKAGENFDLLIRRKDGELWVHSQQ